jgi:hypothetical protein
MVTPVYVGVLRGARDLLRDEVRFAQCALALTAKGRDCDPLSPKAVRWCLNGALRKVAFELAGDKNLARQLVRRCEAELGVGPTAVFSDVVGHRAVLAVLDEQLRQTNGGHR